MFKSAKSARRAALLYRWALGALVFLGASTALAVTCVMSPYGHIHAPQAAAVLPSVDMI
jgi:hypothetical protein